MPSRNDFQFPLLPWEHHGVRFDPRPDAVTSAEFAGHQRTILLKARASRLFFRFAEWATEPGREATFAITRPFFGNTARAADFFHQTFQQKQVARYSTHEYTHKIQGQTTLVWLVNENGKRQSGWAREWCGGDWVAWEDELPPASSANHSIWNEHWHFYLPRAMYDPIWATIASRRFLQSERQNIPTRWIRGSSEELSQILCAYFTLRPELGRQVNERVEEWVEYNLMYDTRVRLWSWNASSSAIVLRSAHWNSGGIHGLYRFDLMADMEPRWAALVAKHNYAVGLQWHYNDKGDAERRQNWWCQTPIFDLDVPLPFADSPSHHEQLEALLFLRRWLRDKVPASDIKAWLIPQT